MTTTPRPGLARGLHDRPLVQVGDDRVRPPQHDEAAVGEVVGAQADERAGGLQLPRGRRLPADRALQPARARGARRSAGPSRRPARAPGCRRSCRAAPPRRRARRRSRASRSAMCAERLVPRDALERALALRARAHERMAQPVGAVGALEEVADLGAQAAARERMLLDPDELLGHAVADRDLPGAGVRAVVRTSATDDGRVRRPCGSSRVAYRSARRPLLSAHQHQIVTEARGRPVAAGDRAVEHEDAARPARAVGLALARQRREPAHDHGRRRAGRAPSRAGPWPS